MIRRETRYVYYGTLANIATTAAVLACYVGFVDGALFPTVDAAVIALMLGVIAEIVVVARGTGVMTADT